MTRAPRTIGVALRLAVCGLAALATATHVAAQSVHGDAGSRGYKFLQNFSDARTAAFAGASVASPGGIGPSAVNPAILAGVHGFQAAATHSERFASIRQEYVEIAMPRWGGVISASLRTQSSGDIPMRSIDDGTGLNGVPVADPYGTYGVYDMAVGVAYARTTQSLTWGVGGKIVSEKIYLYTARAYAFDFGALWRKGDWRVGAAVRNIGTSGTMREEETPVAWDALVGTSYSRTVGNVPVRGLADVRFAPDWPETVHLGLEAGIAHGFVIRAGYRRALASNTELDGLTAGAGLAVGPVGVDYAYIPTDTGLGAEHLFSLTLTP